MKAILVIIESLLIVVCLSYGYHIMMNINFFSGSAVIIAGLVVLTILLKELDK